MESILNTTVSCFANYFSRNNRVDINLLNWLNSTKYKAEVERIRSLDHKAERDKIKATLPAITPSSSESQHTGLIQFDIDFKENKHIANYGQLKEQICNIPNVAYCGLSVSGTGYWGLIPIAYPEKHKAHFAALEKIFIGFGIKIDTAPKNVASLRGYSYDPAAYFNHNAIPFVTTYEKPVPIAPAPIMAKAGEELTDQDKVEICIEIIYDNKIDITTGYNNWYAIGCSLASTFGNNGVGYFHQVSQFFPGYDPLETDKQFERCLKATNAQAPSIAVFLDKCRQAGINYADRLEKKQPTIKPIQADPLPALEFYHFTFQELVRYLGYDQALEKVQMYQKLSSQHKNCSTFVIHRCRLLSTYQPATKAA